MEKHTWAELVVTVTADQSDAVAHYIMEQGSTGIVETDSRESRGAVELTAYFTKDSTFAPARRRIEAYIAGLRSLHAPQPAAPEVRTRFFSDEDWNAKWKSFFQPIRVTDHIVIKPSWQQYRSASDDIIIDLDPGMAFGTGTHPSTRMCIQAIDSLAGPSQSLLDVGTGSGILAIIGVRLGMHPVVATDVDYTAVACARGNAEKNGVADRLSLTRDPLHKIPGRFSLVVANILPHVLIDLKPQLLAHLEDGGSLVLSGILQERAPEVIAAFSAELGLVRRIDEEEWAGLIFRRQGPGPDDRRHRGPPPKRT